LLAEDDVYYSEDGQQVTVRLRPGITFHDGTPLNAAAVARSFSRLQTLGVSPLMPELQQILVTEQVDPSGLTILFTLPGPDYDFARLILTNAYAAIVSAPLDNSDPGFVACTGPYYFVPELYYPGKSLSLRRYLAYNWPPSYFTNQGAARIPEIQFLYETDRQKRFEMLLAGQGCVLSLSPGQASQLSNPPNSRLYDTLGGVTYLGFNFLKPHWQELNARQAVAMAIDKSVLASDLFLIAETPLSPTAIGYNPQLAASAYQYDPEQSRTLLANQSDLEGESSITLLFPESATYREMAALIQEQLAAIGIEQVQLRETPRSDILTQRQDFDLLLFDYAWGDYTALEIFLGPTPRNLLHYSQGNVARLVRQARSASDEERRNDLIFQAQQIVLEQGIWQPLLIRRLELAVNHDCVRGERQLPDGRLVFHDATTSSLNRQKEN
jgi:peptide/nickel transport system substrate-binding protein